jgi:hypothetical protein
MGDMGWVRGALLELLLKKSLACSLSSLTRSLKLTAQDPLTAMPRSLGDISSDAPLTAMPRTLDNVTSDVLLLGNVTSGSQLPRVVEWLWEVEQTGGLSYERNINFQQAHISVA